MVSFEKCIGSILGNFYKHIVSAVLLIQNYTNSFGSVSTKRYTPTEFQPILASLRVRTSGVNFVSPEPKTRSGGIVKQLASS